MPLTLKIGSTDLSNYVNVKPGDGFDPTDNDWLSPQFSDSTAGEGASLLGVTAGNQELVWPMHFTPTKDAAWADTKDGLHKMLIDLGRIFSTAKGNMVEWRDDGATSSTFRTIHFVRFEPDFNYRRSQKLWVSGVLRVYCKPYGHTGTFRSLGTAIATNSLPVISIGSLVGDAPAQVDLAISRRPKSSEAVTQQASSAIFVGACAVPSGIGVIATPGHFTSSATIVGIAGAFGSRAARFLATVTAATWANFAFSDLGWPRVDRLEPLRVIGLLRYNRHAGNASGMALRLYGAANPAGSGVPAEGATIVLVPSMGWRTVDLGRFPRFTASQPSDNLAYNNSLSFLLGQVYDGGAGSNTIEIAGMMVLPEERTVAGRLEHSRNHSSFPISSINLLESVNINRHWQGASTGGGAVVLIDKYLRNERVKLPVGTYQRMHAFAFMDNGAQDAAMGVEVSVRERFTYAR